MNRLTIFAVAGALMYAAPMTVRARTAPMAARSQGLFLA